MGAKGLEPHGGRSQWRKNGEVRARYQDPSMHADGYLGLLP